MSMTKIDIAKKAINILVTFGTGKIVNDIIKTNTNPHTALDTVTYTAGSYALGGMVAAEAAKYTDDRIDHIVARWTKKPITEDTDAYDKP